MPQLSFIRDLSILRPAVPMEMCLKRLHIAECLFPQRLIVHTLISIGLADFSRRSMENDSPFSAHDCAWAHTTSQPNRVTMAGPWINTPQIPI
jgi:hypothetical protein